MLKGRDEILSAVRRRFETSVVQVAVVEVWDGDEGAADSGGPGVGAGVGDSAGATGSKSAGTPRPWPYSVALGRPTADMLANHMEYPKR